MKNTNRILFVVTLGVLLALLGTTVSGAKANTENAAKADNDTESVASLEQLEPILLPVPSFKYYVSPAIDSAKVTKTKKLTLTQKSVKKIQPGSNYSDSATLESNEYLVPNPFRNQKGNLPKGIPTEYKGQMLVRAIKDKNDVILIYGLDFGENRYLVVMDKSLKKVLKAYDFTNYAISPKYIKEDYDYIDQQIKWAVIENGILYVSHSHSTYAKSSNGMNGYITAIRLSDNKILWRTAPLVCNSQNFQVVGNVILSGYGFTAEKDYLYQIDKLTGKTLDKILLKDGPDYIEKQKNNIRVHGYAHITQFLIKS